MIVFCFAFLLVYGYDLVAGVAVVLHVIVIRIEGRCVPFLFVLARMVPVCTQQLCEECFDFSYHGEVIVHIVVV